MNCRTKIYIWDCLIIYLLLSLILCVKYIFQTIFNLKKQLKKNFESKNAVINNSQDNNCIHFNYFIMFDKCIFKRRQKKSISIIKLNINQNIGTDINII